MAKAQGEDFISFAVGTPGTDLLPLDELGRVSAEVLGSAHRVLQYGLPSAALKERIVELMATRGVACRPEQVVLTSGSQQGMDLLARLLLDPGDAVALEEAVYDGIQMAVRGRRPRVLSVPSDPEHGIDLDAFEALLADGERPRFLYVIPMGHNPMGTSLAPARRERLLDAGPALPDADRRGRRLRPALAWKGPPSRRSAPKRTGGSSTWDRCRRSLRRACASVGPWSPKSWRSSSRRSSTPPTWTPRPSPSTWSPATWPRAASRTAWRGCAPSTGAAATPCSPPSSATCRRAPAGTGPTPASSSGPTCPTWTGHRHHGAARAGDRGRRRVLPGRGLRLRRPGDGAALHAPQLRRHPAGAHGRRGPPAGPRARRRGRRDAPPAQPHLPSAPPPGKLLLRQAPGRTSFTSEVPGPTGARRSARPAYPQSIIDRGPSRRSPLAWTPRELRHRAPRPARAGHRPARCGAGIGRDQGDDSGIFPYPVYQQTLDNGLVITVIPFDSPGIVAYYSVVRAGSRQEVEPGHSGFAHFFEHMMFRGTEKYPSQAVQRRAQEDGRRLERLHHRRLDQLLHRRPVGPAREDDGPGERPVHQPPVLGVRLPHRGAGDPGRVQQERLRAVPADVREAPRAGVRQAHLRAHHHGLPGRHQGHARRVRLQPPVLRPVLPAEQRQGAGGR